MFLVTFAQKISHFFILKLLDCSKETLGLLAHVAKALDILFFKFPVTHFPIFSYFLHFPPNFLFPHWSYWCIMHPILIWSILSHYFPFHFTSLKRSKNVLAYKLTMNKYGLGYFFFSITFMLHIYLSYLPKSYWFSSFLTVFWVILILSNHNFPRNLYAILAH